MHPNTIEQIFARFSASLSDPKTELNYTNDFTLLVAIILSAQSTDIGVNKATAKLFAFADTPSKILTLGEEGLKNYIKTIGLFNNKAKNIIALSKILLEDYNSQVPASFDLLYSLPGVGRKTANVFLNCAYDHPTIAVDTHVFRVSNRLGLVNTGNVLDTEKQLCKVVPEKYKTKAHHWLILHGRYTCKARKPECSKCIVQDLCEYEKKHNL
ncbi:Endonuclease III [Rickettsiales bacterium Ac37b]|nr:Endonuclease III [Rickettsiales bacterium Ac37b]